MTRLIGIILTLIFLSSISICKGEKKDTLKAFWGIPFGSSQKEVKELKKGLESSENDDMLSCRKCTFGKFEGIVMMRFYPGKGMGLGMVALSPAKKELIFELYDDVVSSIFEKYGTPTKIVEEFEALYDDGRGREFPTLSIPTSRVLTTWELTSSSNPLRKSKIIVVITRDFRVAIRYSDDAITEDQERKTKQTELNDY